MKRLRLTKSIPVKLLVLLAVGVPTTATAVPPDIVRFVLPGAIPVVVACDGFVVSVVTPLDITLKTFFNNEGAPIRLQSHIEILDSVYFNSEEPSIFVTGRGEVVNQTTDLVTGEFTSVGLGMNVIIPGVGQVWINVGRVVFDAAGNLIFRAGHTTSTDDGAALCAALTP